MDERRFHLVHFKGDGAAHALVWAADQHLHAGCRFVDDEDCTESANHDAGVPTTLRLPDEDARLWGDREDPEACGEAFRCGLLWNGVRSLCAHLQNILLPSGDELNENDHSTEICERGGEGGGGDGAWYPRRVIELGAGMGINGIVSAQLLFQKDEHDIATANMRRTAESDFAAGSQPAEASARRPLVVLTDYHTAVLDLLRLNVGMNRVDGHCAGSGDGDGDGGANPSPPRTADAAAAAGALGARVLTRRLAWGDEAEADAVKRLTSHDNESNESNDDESNHNDNHRSAARPPPPPPPPPRPFDLVIAADIIYSAHVIPLLYSTVESLLSGAPPGARFIMAHTERPRLLPRVRLIPRVSIPGSNLAGGGGGSGGGARGGGGAQQDEELRDENLDLFLAKAAAYGFVIREVGFERRAGEEAVHLFDVRPIVVTHSSSSSTVRSGASHRHGHRRRDERDDEYDVFTLDD
jgi:hypothetical protein